MNGITGLRPSREGLTPKPAETRVDQPLAPVVGRASTRLAAMAEVSTGPRLTEEAPEVRLVSAPDADLPGAPSPGSGLVADSGFTGGATSSPIAEAEGLLTYEVLYNDDTGISPYAET